MKPSHVSYPFQDESTSQLQRKRGENSLYVYTRTPLPLHLEEYLPLNVNLNNLGALFLFIILSVGLLPTYLTEFREPVPSHLPFASGLACDWRRG